ncbi:MAG: glycosyltransferase family 4 protein [Promethearchaeota archaeon]
MNIIHVPPRYFPAISGAEFYFKRISESLNDHFNLEVHTTNALDFQALHDIQGKKVQPKKQPEIIKKVKVFRHPVIYSNDRKKKEIEKVLKPFCRNQTLNDALLLKMGPYSTKMRIELDKRNVDLIHTTFFPSMNIFTSLQVSIKKKIPIVLTPFFHGENPRYYNDLDSLLKLFSKLLVCTKAERNYLLNLGIDKKKIELITMGVDLERYKNVDERKFTTTTGIDPSKHKIILFSGYKNYEKGAITILKSIPSIVQVEPDARFVLIGPSTKQFNIQYKKLGKMRKYICNLNPSNLSGYYDKIKLGAFKSCHVYAMPSRSDAFGIAYLEAWAFKKPIIASKIPAMEDLFDDYKEGIHVSFDDPQMLSEKILELLRDSKKREEIGEKGHEKVLRDHLTWRDVSEKIKNIYLDLMS